jgi:hypothetical protein
MPDFLQALYEVTLGFEIVFDHKNAHEQLSWPALLAPAKKSEESKGTGGGTGRANSDAGAQTKLPPVFTGGRRN